MPGRAGRSLRWVGEQAAFLVVVVGIVVALVYLALSAKEWKPGTVAIAVAVVAAGVLRLLLPTDRVGLLAIRSRWIDTACYLLLGGLILAVDLRLHD